MAASRSSSNRSRQSRGSLAPLETGPCSGGHELDEVPFLVESQAGDSVRQGVPGDLQAGDSVRQGVAGDLQAGDSVRQGVPGDLRDGERGLQPG